MPQAPGFILFHGENTAWLPETATGKGGRAAWTNGSLSSRRCQEVHRREERHKERRHLAERTLVLLKPDAVARGLTGEIVGRLEKKGLRLAGMKMIWTKRWPGSTTPHTRERRSSGDSSSTSRLCP
jgi:hypothetical protein